MVSSPTGIEVPLGTSIEVYDEPGYRPAYIVVSKLNKN
jgi:hypothetical protein